MSCRVAVAAHEIGAAVADIGDRRVGADDDGEDKGRARVATDRHASHGHCIVRRRDGSPQRPFCIVNGLCLGQDAHRRSDRGLGRLEPPSVAAHAIRQREHGRPPVGGDARIPDVLVLRPNRSAIRDPGDLEGLTIAGDRPLGAVVRHAPAPASAAAGWPSTRCTTSPAASTGSRH